MQKYEVYHTTKKKFGKIILETRTFICSDRKIEWLGKGVYFWGNRYTATEFWPKARKIKEDEVMVLKANLEVDEAYTLNLDEEDQFNDFEKFCDDLKQELIKNKQYIPVKNKIEMLCFYLNYYKKLYEIALIIRTFPGKRYKDILSVNRKQYCVSEKFKDAIIKDVEELV